MSDLPAPPGLAEIFALILGGLCRAVAARSATDRAARPILLVAYVRLSRTAQKFAALVARVQAARLSPPRRRLARPRSGLPRPPDPLPRRFALLARLVPGAACFGTQLQHFLAQPETEALLKTAPQAGRIVRPLCRMLGAEIPPSWRLPPRPPRPRPPRPRPSSPPSAELAEPGAAAKNPAPAEGSPAVYVWRRWRGIRMPELVRPSLPAAKTPARKTPA